MHRRRTRLLWGVHLFLILYTNNSVVYLTERERERGGGGGALYYRALRLHTFEDKQKKCGIKLSILAHFTCLAVNIEGMSNSIRYAIMSLNQSLLILILISISILVQQKAKGMEKASKGVKGCYHLIN